MSTNIVGVYDDQNEAEQVRQRLTSANISESDIRTVTPQDMRDGKTRSDYQGDDASMGEKISDFFSSLFGSDEEDKIGSRYLEAVRRGSTLVVVETNNDEDIERAREILDSDTSVDIDQRSRQFKDSGWSDYDENAEVYSDDQAREERQRFETGANSQETTSLSEGQQGEDIGSSHEQRGKAKVFDSKDEGGTGRRSERQSGRSSQGGGMQGQSAAERNRELEEESR